MSADASMWGRYGARPQPNHDLDALFGSISVAAHMEVARSPENAWDLISTNGQIGEPRPECVDAWWTPDSPARAARGRVEAATGWATESTSPSGFAPVT